MKKLEEEKSKPSPSPSPPPQLEKGSITPVPASFGSHLQPKGLDFNTPQSRKRSHSAMVNTPSTGTFVTPQHDRPSDVDSLSSENTNSSVTPDMLKLNLGKRRGRPRKELVEPTMDDFPFGPSKEEQHRYIRKKNTEKWHYNKLVGSDAASYRQAEINCVNLQQKEEV